MAKAAFEELDMVSYHIESVSIETKKFSVFKLIFVCRLSAQAAFSGFAFYAFWRDECLFYNTSTNLYIKIMNFLIVIGLLEFKIPNHTSLSKLKPVYT